MKISSRDSLAMIKAIGAEENFTTHGALSGVANPEYAYPGQMPEAHAQRLARDLATGDVTYMIVSYVTPIAWKMRDGSVRRPRVTYSRTTSAHQGKAGYVLGE